MPKVDANFAASTGLSGAVFVTANVTDVSATGRRLRQQGNGVLAVYDIQFTLPEGTVMTGMDALVQSAVIAAAGEAMLFAKLLQVGLWLGAVAVASSAAAAPHRQIGWPQRGAGPSAAALLP
jgi:hypothetical protein